MRKAKYAGSFYPENEIDLRKMINAFLDEVPDLPTQGRLKGLIVPHAGYAYSGPIAAHGFKLLKRLDMEREWKILLIGPSHHAFFEGAAVSRGEWDNPLGKVEARDLRDEVKSEFLVDFPEAHEREHSLEVEIPFLQVCLKKFVLYPLCLGMVPDENLARDLKEFCARDDVIVVVSSDLSHYHSYDEAYRIDESSNEAILKDDYDIDIDACGRVGISVLRRLKKELGWEGKLLDYRNSGDTEGDKNCVVGYSAFGFFS